MEHSRILRRAAGCLLAVSLGLFGLPGPLAGVSTVRAVEKPVIVVDSPFDLPLEGTDCTSVPPGGKCTLRAALIYANTQSLKYYQVVFAEALQSQDIVLAGSQGTLLLATTCAAYGDCLLDGGARRVRIDGSDLAPDEPILQVGGSHNTIRGLAFVNAKGDGIRVGTAQGSWTSIEDNLFLGNAGAGVSVLEGGSNTTISGSLFGLAQDPSPGGCLPGQANRTGIQVSGPVSQVRIEANTIACSAEDGISILAGAPSVWATIISENRIGLDQGEKARGNGGAGIHDHGDRTMILGNTVSGNAGDGIHLEATHGTVIDGNRIGVSAAGDAPIPNGLAGISGEATVEVQIGSDGDSPPQVISANHRQGILLRGAVQTRIKSSNRIGVGAGGLQPLGNGLEGILIEEATVGTILQGAIVAYNGRAGVAVSSVVEAANYLRPEQVYRNGGLPIDLGNDGPTPNPTSPGGYPGYPVLLGSAGPLLWGSACPGCLVEIYRALGNPAAPGGGGIWLASTAADSAGAWRYELPGSGTGEITLLAVEPGPSPRSSELSPRQQMFLPLVVTG